LGCDRERVASVFDRALRRVHRRQCGVDAGAAAAAVLLALDAHEHVLARAHIDELGRLDLAGHRRQAFAAPWAGTLGLVELAEHCHDAQVGLTRATVTALRFLVCLVVVGRRRAGTLVGRRFDRGRRGRCIQKRGRTGLGGCLQRQREHLWQRLCKPLGELAKELLETMNLRVAKQHVTPKLRDRTLGARERGCVFLERRHAPRGSNSRGSDNDIRRTNFARRGGQDGAGAFDEKAELAGGHDDCFRANSWGREHIGEAPARQKFLKDAQPGAVPEQDLAAVAMSVRVQEEVARHRVLPEPVTRQPKEPVETKA
jgi:hypothetical protein